MAAAGEEQRLLAETAAFYEPPPRRRRTIWSHATLNSLLVAAVGVVLVTLELSADRRMTALESESEGLRKRLQAAEEATRKVAEDLSTLKAEAAAEAQVETALAGRLDEAFGEVEELGVYVHSRLDNMTTNNDLQDDVITLRSDMAEQRKAVVSALQDKEREMEANLEQAREGFADLLNVTLERTAASMEAYKENFRNYSHALKANLDAGFDAQKEQLDRFRTDVNTLEHGLDDYITSTNAQFKVEHSIIADWIAGTFTLLAFLISMRHVYGHTSNFNKPVIQRKILAILWMVPIYGVTSWVSLVIGSHGPKDVKPTLTLIRDFYEAYCIYMFMALMVSILGEGDMQKCIKALPIEVDRPFVGCIPSCLLPCRPRTSARTFLWQCQLAAIQFVVLKPLLSIAAFALGHFDLPAPRTWYDYWHYELYITILLNISVGTAFYGLACFYHTTHKQLAKHRPWPKFLCIKGVVFLTFWQNMTITVLLFIGYQGIENEAVAESIQSFLICIEMFLAATMHTYTFGYEEWQDGYEPPVNVADMTDNFAARDFLRDFQWVLTPGGIASSGGSRTPGTERGKLKDAVGAATPPPPNSPPEGEAGYGSTGTSGSRERDEDAEPGGSRLPNLFSLADAPPSLSSARAPATQVMRGGPQPSPRGVQDEQKTQSSVLGLMP